MLQLLLTKALPVDLGELFVRLRRILLGFRVINFFSYRIQLMRLSGSYKPEGLYSKAKVAN